MNLPTDEVDLNQPEMRVALARMLLQTSAESCLSAEDLIDWTTETLPQLRARQIEEHLQQCPICADAALSLQKAFQPIIALQQGWLGWRGPILAATGRLDPVTARAWREQCTRHEVSRRRTERLRATLALFKPTLTFASGAVCAGLLFLMWGRPISQHPTPPPGPQASPPDLQEYRLNVKAGEIGEPNDPAQKLIERATEPKDEQMSAAIKIWNRIAVDHPGNPTPWTALARLYERQGRQTRDPKQRQAAEEKARKSLSFALRALSEPARSSDHP